MICLLREREDIISAYGYRKAVRSFRKNKERAGWMHAKPHRHMSRMISPGNIKERSILSSPLEKSKLFKSYVKKKKKRK